ncbi:hypothetical protein PCANC_25943 [Puccinia coronata f. sp. avenae]|uniref:Uncharacterized protein n=1 Tax=Puccinia coronata f. sp. avenae TaxID=200324 RepID=A0A2N5U6D4_9BASI|nr:hypothetical protein PCANC_25943 [Puccinia coronata f. sp. avenae]
MWKDWGGYIREKKKRPATTPLEPIFKGKKREMMAEMEANPVSKKRKGEVKRGGIPPTSGSQAASTSNSHVVAAMGEEQMTLGELLFEQLSTVGDLGI